MSTHNSYSHLGSTSAHPLILSENANEKKKRGSYSCSKCGEPKKGHLCKPNPESPPPLPIYMNQQKKKRKTVQTTSPAMTRTNTEEGGIVLQTLATAIEHDPRPSLKSVKPRIDASYESLAFTNFRKNVTKRCYMAQECCISLSEGLEVFLVKIKKVVAELVTELAQLREKFFGSESDPAETLTHGNNIEVAKILTQFNDKGGNGYFDGETGSEQILNYLHSFTEELYNEWTSDETGLRSSVEDILFSLWEEVLHKLQYQVHPTDILEWGELVYRYDTKGRLKLKLDAFPELSLLSLRPEINAFKELPSFEVYKSISDRLVDHPTTDNLKKEMIDSLQITDPNQLRMRINILIHEQKYQQLQEEVAPLKSNEFLVEIGMHMIPMFPNEVVLKSEKEVLEALSDAMSELEEGFEVGVADQFKKWEQSGFKVAIRKDEDDTEDDYPDDHYISYVRRSFVMDDKEIDNYQTYMHQYADLEALDALDTASLDPTYNFIRSIRGRERTCLRIFKNLLGWMNCAKAAYHELAQREAKDPQGQVRLPNTPPNFDSFVTKVITQLKDWLAKENKSHLLLVCNEVACVSTWQNVLQEEFFKLVSTYKAIYTGNVAEFVDFADKNEKQQQEQ